MGDSIFGCFVSVTMGDENGKLFRKYIFGEKGISENFKVLKYYNYGTDIKTILFQFYINPEPYLLDNIKEIENYRKKEKAIGIPIIINDNNFFNKSEAKRIEFLGICMLDKLNLLSRLVVTNRLDVNMQLLIFDFEKIWNKFY